MPENTIDKGALRRPLLANRQAIAPEVRRGWDAAINRRVLAWWEAGQPMALGVFWPIRGEPDLRPVYAELAARGVQLALPLVVGKEAALRFAHWAPGDPLKTDAFGVAIPVDGSNTSHPAALLVPCVGFNDANIRLGYGGGFYDRTLAVPPRPQTVGIAYNIGLADFSGAAHDIALDRIITEQGEAEA